MVENFEFEEKPNWKAKLREKFSALSPAAFFGNAFRSLKIKYGKKSGSLPPPITHDIPSPEPEYTHSLSHSQSEDAATGMLDRPIDSAEPTGETPKQNFISQFTSRLSRPSSSSTSDSSSSQMPAFLKTVLSGAFLSALLSILLIAYGMARLFNAYIGSKIPEPSTIASRSAISAGNAGRMNTPSLFDYQMITNRNLFSSKNQIPGDEEGGVKKDIDNIPVKSTLPLNLIGTVVLQDELKSVATIEDKSSNLIVPVRIDDEITGKIKILKIETSQVIFRNLASGKKEFINLGDASPVIQLGTSAISGTQPTRKNTKDANYKIEKLSPNQFVMNRGELDRALGDFNNLLTQARAVPYMEGGQPAGFQLVQIDPGSFYEKAGFKIGDVVQGVNGDPVTDVSKALELFNALKTGTHVEIQVKTDGKASTRVYDIK